MSKIFNIGFNKSGTRSLALACQILGLNVAHYRLQGGELLHKIIGGNERDGRPLLQSLEEFDFYADFEGENFFKLLDEQYRGSRFILTLREPESWLDSLERHVLRNQKNPDYRGDFLVVDKDEWIKTYMEYIAEVTGYFAARTNDFLVVDITAGDGWEKIAPFLGKEIPSVPFPHRRAGSFVSGERRHR